MECAMTINFARVVVYLDGIANQPGVDLSSSPHGPFWRVTRDQFVAGSVSDTTCRDHVDGAAQNVPIPIVHPHNAMNSPILNILLTTGLQRPMTDGSTCKKRQMPGGGPFVTDPASSITLADGSAVTGAQILADLRDWIDAGCPE
jgi:hypothetical protein